MQEFIYIRSKCMHIRRHGIEFVETVLDAFIVIPYKNGGSHGYDDTVFCHARTCYAGVVASSHAQCGDVTCSML